MDQILVVGGSGFIGSHLVNRLASSEPSCVTVLDHYARRYGVLPQGVCFIQASLADTSRVREILIERQIKVVYHIRWGTIHETATRDPIADVQTNLISTLGLLEVCREANVKRIIFISSGGAVYGAPQALPVAENHPTNPLNAYGITKLAAEKYLQMYHHLYGLEYVIFRPSSPYGPWQYPHRGQGAVVVFIERALAGQPVTIYGDGSSLRDYFYIDDMTSALVSALNCPFTPEGIYNLAGNEAYTLNELVRIIEDTLEVKIQVTYEPARKIDVPRLRLDISAAASRLGWQPTTPLSEGIKLTAAWIRQLRS